MRRHNQALFRTAAASCVATWRPKRRCRTLPGVRTVFMLNAVEGLTPSDIWKCSTYLSAPCAPAPTARGNCCGRV